MTSVRGVDQRYGRRGAPVLRDVTLELRPGEPVLVEGANGSGKSTLLRVVAGLTVPTRGRVTGRSGGVAYLPDRFPATVRMPARSYLRHLQRITGRPAVLDWVAVLDRLGFTGGPDTPMSRLSKGNAQKVGVAQALCSGAALLVLDEPWSGLDSATRPVLTALLRDAAGAGAAIVVTDHTGSAPDLPPGRVPRLVDGRLVEGRLVDGRGTDPAMVVLLACPDPARVAREVRRATAPECDVQAIAGGLSLLVPAEATDPVLRAVLRLGCSVRAVTPEPHRTPSGRWAL